METSDQKSLSKITHMNIKGMVAIVTGASSGIGLATTKLLSQKGAKVALVARSKEILEKVNQEIPNSIVITADMRKREDIKRMVKETVEHFGTVDILINNAGRGYDSLIEKIDPENYTELFQLNLLGPLLAMEEVIPILKKNGRGSIVNVSSGTSLLAIPNLGAYSSLKRALVGLSLTANEEVKKYGIVVSVIYPFMTITNFGKNIMGKPREEMLKEKDLPEADSAEFVAEKLVKGIESGETEIFVHDWMKN